MNSRDSYIVDVLHRVAHHFCGDYGLFCDWDVARAGRHYRNHSLAIFLPVALEHNGTSQGTILDVFDHGSDGCILFLGRARGEHVATVGRQASKNIGYLCGGLAEGEDYFGHPLPYRAMMIDLGESEVFKGQVTKALDCFVGGKAFFSNLIEQLAK